MERNDIELAKKDRGIAYFNLVYSSMFPIITIAGVSYLSARLFEDNWKAYAAAFIGGFIAGNIQLFGDCFEQLQYSIEEIKDSNKRIKKYSCSHNELE